MCAAGVTVRRAEEEKSDPRFCFSQFVKSEFVDQQLPTNRSVYVHSFSVDSGRVTNGQLYFLADATDSRWAFLFV